MDANYVQVIELTEEEMFKEYMKLKKEMLAWMLIQNQRLLEEFMEPKITTTTSAGFQENIWPMISSNSLQTDKS